MKKKFLALLLLALLFSSVSFADDYPKVDISGYKIWEYKTLDVDPKSNYFLGLTQIGYSPTSSGLSWQEKLKLGITAELSQKLKVTYNIVQEPESPETFDVRVNYDDKHELIFGDMSATFKQNEFTSATKSLNGVMIKSKGDNYNLLFVPSAKLRSQVQALTSQKGNNIRGPYSLGRGSIVEGSERIELNGVVLRRRVDYVIDYFEGKITFNDILTSLDEFKYTYEYTNILDFFFPTLSKRNFVGFEGSYKLDPYALAGQELPVEFMKLSTAESFPNVTYSVTDEPFTETEGIILYRLSNYPVVEFSEKVSFEGRSLVKNEDYRIDYTEGLLRVHSASVPDLSNPLSVVFDYYRVSSEVDSISGIGSQGDYYLKKKGIISGSEKIKVDGKLLARNFDYTINYKKSTIFFYNQVSNTSLIQAVYDYKLEDLDKEAALKKQTYGEVGMSFMSESAKQGGGLPTADYSESINGSDIISNQGAIYLKNRPLVATSEGGRLIVTKNGSTLVAGVDFAIPSVEADAAGAPVVSPSSNLAYLNYKYDLSDGYATATIKMLTTIEATDIVTASYTYNKSIVGRFSGSGNGNNEYEIRGFTSIVPGSEIVLVKEPGLNPVPYQRNSSPEAYDGGTKGYSINYYNPSIPRIIFNEILPPDKSFSIEFRYVPPAADQGGNIEQQVFGLDLGLKLGKLLEFSGEMATSNKDKVTSTTSTSETFRSFATPTRRLPKLANVPVIENSEKVYVNNYLRNRDIDYIIDNTNGVITFYYITLGTSDSVSVDYSYETTSGASIEVVKNYGSAYKYGVKSSIGFFDFAYDKKDVGSSFSPMGGLSLGLGSNAQNFSTKFDPKFHDVVMMYDYKETNDPLSSRTGRYTRNYDRRYSMSLNPNKLANVGVSLRRYENLADDNTRNNLQFDWAGSLVPVSLTRGVLALAQKYELRRSNADDRIARSKTSSDYFNLQEALDITKRVKLSYNYQVSEPQQLSNYGTTREALSSKSYSRNYSYDANFDLTTGSLSKWTAYAKQSRSEQYTIQPTSAYAETRNTTYHMDLRPYTVLTTLIDYNRSETPSVVVENKNPMDERTSLSLKLNPSSRLNGGVSYSENSSVYQTGREGGGRSNSYDFNFVPFKTNKVEFATQYSLLYRTAVTPSGSFESSLEEQTLNQNYSITFKPVTILSLTPGFMQTEYWNIKDGSMLKTKAQTTNAKASLNIFSASITGEYDLKVTTRLMDMVSRHKSSYGVKVSRGLFAWGTLVGSYFFEHNMGEVLTSGTFPDQDYEKKVYDLSMNFNIPSTINPVLSSIGLVGRAKRIYYVNNQRSSDNFKATTLSFEGTLNF